MNSGRSIESAVTLGPDELDWTAYALKYDLMCEFIPAYQEMINTLLQKLSECNLPPNASICDLGAGTGNFITAIASKFPDVHYTHVENSPGMVAVAQQKYEKNAIKHVEVLHESAFSVDFEENSFDSIICINALYAMDPQTEVLARVKKWLKPDGKFLVIDWGRENRILDWCWYVVKNAIRTHGFRRTLSAFIEGAETIKQNRRGRKGHESGKFWRHTTQEFSDTLIEAGFNVEHLSVVYRGYSDLAICSIKE
ncbi:MAG: class I SAM-dependent methyltransferase [Pseudomonadales bacterium]|nr:class I SAM-dependent methyltransferase [Pseudomonadales bacterium]